MMSTYVRLFGEQPKEYPSPLKPNDNPELDTSELLDLPGIKTFQSMIGACQWIIQLGRFDIAVHIMCLWGASSLHQGLDILSAWRGYMVTWWDSRPVLSGLGQELPTSLTSSTSNMTGPGPFTQEWRNLFPTIHPWTERETCQVILLRWCKPYHNHNKANGRAVTAVLHFINKIPFDWFAKTQKIVNTATFGAKSTAARTAIEQMRTHTGRHSCT